MAPWHGVIHRAVSPRTDPDLGTDNSFFVTSLLVPPCFACAVRFGGVGPRRVSLSIPRSSPCESGSTEGMLLQVANLPVVGGPCSEQRSREYME